MSQTRILCKKCKFPQIHCQCGNEVINNTDFSDEGWSISNREAENLLNNLGSFNDPPWTINGVGCVEALGDTEMMYRLTATEKEDLIVQLVGAEIRLAAGHSMEVTIPIKL